MQTADGSLQGWTTPDVISMVQAINRGAPIDPEHPSVGPTLPVNDKTAEGQQAAKDELMNSMATSCRTWYLCSLDAQRTITMPISTQFIREDTTGKAFSMTTCLSRIISDLARVGITIHYLSADNAQTHTVRDS